jgi:hypothetical protein
VVAAAAVRLAVVVAVGMALGGPRLLAVGLVGARPPRQDGGASAGQQLRLLLVRRAVVVVVGAAVIAVVVDVRVPVLLAAAVVVVVVSALDALAAVRAVGVGMPSVARLQVSILRALVRVRVAVAVAVAAAAGPRVAAAHLRSHLQRWRQLALAARLAVSVAVPAATVPGGVAVAVVMAVAVAVAAGLPPVVVAQHGHHQYVDTHACRVPNSEHSASGSSGARRCAAHASRSDADNEVLSATAAHSPMTAMMNITAVHARGEGGRQQAAGQESIHGRGTAQSLYIAAAAQPSPAPACHQPQPAPTFAVHWLQPQQGKGGGDGGVQQAANHLIAAMLL